MGSGPGGLQAAYYLSRLGIDHAVITADPGPGGMFRRFPFFQRLLSWTKPYARPTRDSREFERYDWNSLVAFEPEQRAVMASLMDGSSEFPSRGEMEEGLRRFAQRHRAGRVRYGVPWQCTRRDGEHYVLETPDRASTAPGSSSSRWGSPSHCCRRRPGIEHAAHYVETREAASYAGKRLFIIGKQNSGFELASGLLQWASPIILASPRPAQLSVNLHSLGGVRARYIQPWEDAVLGGGVFILDAGIDRIERREHALVVHARRTDTSEPVRGRGRRGHRRDRLPRAAPGPRGHRGQPFRTQRAAGHDQRLRERHGTGHLLRGHHRPGRRRPAQVRHPRQLRGRCTAIATTSACSSMTSPSRWFGQVRARPAVPPGDVVARLLAAATNAPELWHQKSYLAQALSRDAGRQHP